MRLLWIQPGAIGDFIVVLPGMAWVKQILTPAWFEVWAERINLPLVQAPAYADQAVALPDTGLDRYPPPAGLLERLQEFDLVLSWWGAGTAALARLHPNSYFLKSLPPDASCHILDFKRSQLENLFGSSLAGFPHYPKIAWTSEDIEFAGDFAGDHKHQPIALIHPSASGKRKQWPVADYAALAVRLAAEKGMQIFLDEGPLDGDLCDELARFVEASNVKVQLRRVRLTNLRQLSAVLSLCALYIGNDSGITHLAAASGTCTLAIFTVTDPKVWAPRGPSVWVCMNPDVDEVWAKVNDALRSKKHLQVV